MNVKKIWAVGICRDGGSYSLCFDSDDGHWYEFFLKTRVFEGAGPSHEPPVIYLGSVNDNHAIRSLTWQEAKVFIAHTSFEDKRFEELRHVIETEGGTAQHSLRQVKRADDGPELPPRKGNFSSGNQAD